MNSRQLLLASFVCFLSIGCSHHAPVVKDTLAYEQLSFLQDGVTEKRDVLIRLGIPSAQFQGEEILTYRMMLNEDDSLVAVSRELDSRDPRISQWRQAEYSLVLVFGDNHVLQKHSLVKVR